MGSGTQIKGHRIGDEQIELKHLHSDIKIPEKNLDLKYATHSNAGDLTVEQKNVMTMGGNADSLHYHTGGGGGPQGIYTNEERDAQLLKLAMLVNANVFGLDKAMVDNFDDDSSIYRGYKSAKSPTLSALTNNLQYPGTLKQNTEYTYGVSYKNKYGQTNVINVASCLTESGLTNAIRMQMDDVPSDNEGISIYRTEGSTELLFMDDSNDRWVNQVGLMQEEYAVDKTIGLTATAITHENSIDAAVEYVSENMGVVSGVSQPLNTQVNANVPFDFYLISKARTPAYSLEILWSAIPSFAPRDYEVYYTTDTQVADFEKANWQKFTKLEPHYVGYNVKACFGTNGTIEDNYRVTNNTLPENKFYINPVEGITYIRIKVTRIDNLCKLVRVNMVGAERSHNRPFFINMDGIDLTPYNTIKFDYKTSGYQIPMHVEAQRKDENVGSVTRLLNVSHGNFNKYMGEYRDSWITCRINHSDTITCKDYNRIRIGIRVASNSDFRAENFYLRLVNSNTDWYTPGRNVIQAINIPITFNGKPYVECNETDSKDIYSDWIYLPLSYNTIYGAELTFKQIRGTLLYHASNGYVYTSNSETYLGCEDKVNKFVNVNALSSRCIYLVEFGKTNSASRNLTSNYTHEKWHRTYVDITSIDSLKYLKFFTGATDINTGRILLDNFTLTKNKNLLGATVSHSYEMSDGATVSNVNADSYGLSINKQVVFNQYATTDNPQIIAFKFNEKQVINQINVTCYSKVRTPTNYILQFSTNESAKFDDPLSSNDWLNFSNVRIGETGFDNGFTGSIRGSRVIANNISNTNLAHRFDEAEVMKVRIYIEGTIGGQIPMFNNVEIYSAVDSQELKLIYNEDKHVSAPRFIFVDDGIKEKDITTQTHNTTGSFNILWNKDKHMVEVIDKTLDAVLYTNIISTELFQDFMLCAQYLGEVIFEMSFDEGDTFVPITLDQVNDIGAQTDSAVIRVILKDEATLHALAMLYTL